MGLFSPIRSPIGSPIFLGLGGVFGGLIYPPVRDKLLAWVSGPLVGGADIPYSVDNPDELYGVDPVADLYGIYRRDMDLTNGNFPMRLSHSHCLTLGIGDSVEIAGHGTIVSHGGTAVLSYDGTTLTETTPGTVFNLIFSDGSHWPCSDGSGGTLHSSDGLSSGTITSVTAWDNYQDEYYYNVVSGYWDNGDGVKYPSDPGGGATLMRGGTWNGTENKYTFYEPLPAAIIAHDNLEGPYLTDGVSVGIPRTEAEITAYVADKYSIYFCPERGLKSYNEILTGDEAYYALLDCGQAEAVTFEGEIVTFGGEIVYIRS